MDLRELIIGEVKSVEKHPNADRLNITQVDLGEDKNYTIVCGAPNVKKRTKGNRCETWNYYLPKEQ